MVDDIVKELYPLIAKSAPVLANALGLGKIGQAGMWAIYLLGKAFGIDMQNVSELPSAINNDPDSDSKLTELEDSFSEWFLSNSSRMTKNVKISDVELNIKVNFEQSNQNIT